jgi:hypothetical protein
MTLDGSRLEGVVLRRTNGSVQAARSFSASLSLNPLTTGPELVGREIRNCLDSAGIRERACVVGLPINWVLTAVIDVPEMSEQDADNLIALEAERAFPCDPGSLQIVAIKSPTSAGKSTVLLAGVPKANVELLSSALRAAKLQPASFSLALPALAPVSDKRQTGIIALSIGESSVGLQVNARDGIASLRAIEGALDQQAGQRVLNTAAVAREIRITLGQLPPTQRETIRHIRIFGPEDLAQQLADDLDLRFEAMGLEPEVAKRTNYVEHGLKVPSDAPVSGSFSLAAQQLAGAKSDFQFLPPHTSAWQRMSKRYASGRLRLAVAGAAAAVLLVAGLFAYQQWRLTNLQSEWSGISSRVAELETLQERLRRFRPWNDDSVVSLTILKQLTTAFPAEGTVNAKTVEIRNGESVTCSGTARDNRSLLATLDKLMAEGGVSDVKVSQLRGRSPAQFTFDFRSTREDSK